ncbi:pyruvate kinase [Herminiimonas sp.]|uniref:pyruvate kinase n=1 Tax=Herminiimonas sp. TaxID=1926289 RepID=UPI00271F62D0|nr:pyruvate kinase [Herminiimonas sp.]MDO8304364.1 pyruvate kinase [Herminiimonas sp.]
MRRIRKAKIVATLGPASNDLETITELFDAGVDMFRFNFSHGSHADHRARHEIVRNLEKKTGRPISILADLQGPKIRLGTFAGDSAMLKVGDQFVLDRDETPGDASRVYLPHPELFAAVAAGQNLLLDDGKIRLSIESNKDNRIVTRIAVGGKISNRKGVNVPDAILPIPAMTAKDRVDLDFALSLGVDWVALSFVQQVSDITEAREIIGDRAGIMSKIEKPAAMLDIDGICNASDSVMVARGDLGVELPAEQVPRAQKEILKASRKYGKPVIIATQMLESMTESPVPTRAETSDVASAIYEGADAVMLSAESASGKFPVKAVAMMDRIIKEVESDPAYRALLDAQQVPPLPTAEDAICAALRDVTKIVNAVATVTYTTSGHTTMRAARERPTAPILSITPNINTARRLSLVWGIHSTVGSDVGSVEEMVKVAVSAALREGFAKVGESITVSAGLPFGESGTTNLLHIATVK